VGCLNFGPFSDEVRKDLQFDCCSWDVRDVATHELYCPFGHAIGGIVVLDHVTKWGGCHDHDGVPLKVVQQLLFGDRDVIDKLLDL
jgi:hypothetical protein